MGDRAWIDVEDLSKLQADLRKVDAKLPKELRGKLLAIASRTVDLIRPKLPKITGKLQAATRPYATSQGAGLKWNMSPENYSPMVEFGGYPAGRPFVKAGRYIFPTIDAHRSQLEREIEQAVDEVLKEAGL